MAKKRVRKPPALHLLIRTYTGGRDIAESYLIETEGPDSGQTCLMHGTSTAARADYLAGRFEALGIAVVREQSPLPGVPVGEKTVVKAEVKGLFD